MSELAGRCGTCKHYSRNGSTFGDCTRIVGIQDVRPNFDGNPQIAYRDDDTGEIFDDIVLAVDGSGYKAGVMCKPEFGCVLWESDRKEPPPPVREDRDDDRRIYRR